MDVIFADYNELRASTRDDLEHKEARVFLRKLIGPDQFAVFDGRTGGSVTTARALELFYCVFDRVGEDRVEFVLLSSEHLVLSRFDLVDGCVKPGQPIPGCGQIALEKIDAWAKTANPGDLLYLPEGEMLLCVLRGSKVQRLKKEQKIHYSLENEI